MKFNELFKKVKVANEINKLANKGGVIVELNYRNYNWYKFTDYKQFLKFINEEFIPDIAICLKEAEFEINKEFIITYQDWNGKTNEVNFKVEVL